MRERERALLGLTASAAIALAGWRKAVLSSSGALGAVAVGTAVFTFGGAVCSAVLIAFFALSSALSKVGRQRKRVLDDVAVKGSRRDLGQVLANGGVAATLAVVSRSTPRRAALRTAFVGAMAAVTADTWSTEIGALSRRAPRSIVTGHVVQPGVSGGVTPLGLGASLAGGACIGLVAALAEWLEDGRMCRSAGKTVAMATLAGMAGSVADSLLGATIQRGYRCPRCGVPTEQPVHHCGARSIPERGLAFVDNDTVNLLTSLVGAGVGAWLRHGCDT